MLGGGCLEVELMKLRVGVEVTKRGGGGEEGEQGEVRRRKERDRGWRICYLS